ncbi:hypothetical protein CTAYLR_001251 [Chrysophaeum taylorii]|uniref:Uncharacterized protein n=1 Tax=Chrysophaeum taylorii TaxID=2483200 RepID=A0AAD7UCL6_9STRA|nr:hypothetical protein CTAYLR_001251 [Chrysophaeum taylorii]
MTAVSDVGLGHVFAGIRKLASLLLRGCPAVSDKGLLELSDYMKLRKTLRTLDLRESTGFSNDSLLALMADGGGQLHELLLAGCSQVDLLGLLGLRRDVGTLEGTTLLGIISASCRHLVDLRLAGLGAAVDDAALQAFTSAIEGSQYGAPPLEIVTLSGRGRDLDRSRCVLNNLRRMRMVDTPLFSDEGFANLVAAAHQRQHQRQRKPTKQQDRPFGLIEFDAAAALTGMVDNSTRCRVPRYGSAGILAYVQAFGEQLMRLDLDGAPRIDDTAVLNVGRCCPLLRYVGLEKCAHVTTASVVPLSTQCCHLERLRVGGCGGYQSPLTDAVAFAIAAHCPEMRVLDLSRSRISGKGCRKIASGCPKLETLKLNDCDQVDDSDVCAILGGCPKLRVLNLAGCDAIREGPASLTGDAENRLEVCDLHRSSLGRGVPPDALVRAVKKQFPHARRNSERCGLKALAAPVRKFVVFQLERRRQHRAAMVIQTLVRRVLEKQRFFDLRERVFEHRRMIFAIKVVQKCTRRWANRQAGRLLLAQLRAAKLRQEQLLEAELRRQMEERRAHRASLIMKFMCTAFDQYRHSILRESWQHLVAAVKFKATRDTASRAIGGWFRRQMVARFNKECTVAVVSSAKVDQAVALLYAAAITAQRCYRARLCRQQQQHLETFADQGIQEDAPQSPELPESEDECEAAEDDAHGARSRHEIRLMQEASERVRAAFKFQTAWRFRIKLRRERERRAGYVVMRGWRRYQQHRREREVRRRRDRLVSAFGRFAHPDAVNFLIERRHEQLVAAGMEATRLAICRQRAVRLIQQSLRSRIRRWKATKQWRMYRQDCAAIAIQSAYQAYRQRIDDAEVLRGQNIAAFTITHFLSRCYARQKFRNLQRQLAIRKEEEAQGVKQDLIRRRQERLLQQCFVRGREKSAAKLQASWRAHREAAMQRARRVAESEARLRDARLDFAMSEKAAEAKKATRQLANQTKALAIATAQAGAKFLATTAKIAVQALGSPAEPTPADIVRKGYDLPELPKPKMAERIVNFVLDRRSAQEDKEREEQLSNSILNLQTRSVLARGVIDLALTVGKEELVALEEKNAYNARVNQPVFERVKKDLSGHEKLKVFLWYSMGHGPRVLTEIRVRRAPASHLNKTANESRLYGAFVGGTVIRGHKKLAVELHGDAGVYQGKAAPPIDKVAVSRNAKEEAALKAQNFARITPALNVGGGGSLLAKYNVWIHTRKIHQKPVLNTLMVGMLRRQHWWNGDDERVRSLIATYALPLDAVLSIRAAFDALNFAKGDHIQVQDWLESIGEPKDDPGAYVGWLIDLDVVMKTNCGKQFWFKKKLEFVEARDKMGVERVGMST